ncbi:MAG: mannose-1-phosphate guanylyltransferase/mannose-6-phosphate isomerase, partial [Phycisphaerales bacterium]|nr:mannose-1-phosphate guanylyltransferase/mannose-6-phosphate isomerase [Hyphomonadaceae bacterium]
MTTRIIPAIMSGGAGTRLWPVSTQARPKQFHALSGGDASLFTETALRVKGAAGAITFAPPLILCNVRHAELARA